MTVDTAGNIDAQPEQEQSEYKIVPLDGFKCDSCDALFRERDEDPLYECQNDGTKWIKSEAQGSKPHQCPDCNKFASRIGDYGCPECQEGELQEVELFEIDGDESESDELYETEEDAQTALSDLK